MGSAQDPSSLNRFLYAAANPATLIDPDGHDACVGSECDNATYDDGHEGNDYCVGNCGQSTTETGPGSPGYTGYTPPPTAPSAPRTGTPASSTPVVSQPRPGMPTAALWFELTHPFRPGAFTVLPYGEVNAWDPVLQLAYGRLKGSRGRAILEAHDFSYAGFLDLFNVVDLEYHGRDPVAYDADFWTGAWSPNVYLTDRDRQTIDRYPDLIAGSGGSDPGRLLAMLSLVGAGGSDRGTAPGGTRLTGGARSYQTYTKFNPDSGEIYVGRTSGYGTPRDNLRRRDSSHAYSARGFEPATLDRSATGRFAPLAIRGREQQLIDFYRRQGISANSINGISSRNPMRAIYLRMAEHTFGPLD